MRLIRLCTLISLMLFSSLLLPGCRQTNTVPASAEMKRPTPEAGTVSAVETTRTTAPTDQTATPVPKPIAPAKPVTVKLVAVGDIMLGRGVANRIQRHGVRYPLERVAEQLRGADIAFANLESPFGTKGRPLPGKGIWFRAAPTSVWAMVYAGIDVVTLANNHILDHDTENFLETLQTLDEHRIAYTGGGPNIARARQPIVKKVQGVRVAFLGYSQFADLFWDWKYPRSFAALEDRPGVAPLRKDYIKEDIARARENADIVAVAVHWGEEYVNHPSQEQRRLAHMIIDAGADLVLGSHPHAIQGVEEYNKGLIAYSLGNFVMDQQRPITRESMILEVTLTKEGLGDYRIMPVTIENGQPRLAEGAELARLEQKIKGISVFK